MHTTTTDPVARNSACPSIPTDTGEWQTAMATFEQAVAESDAHDSIWQQAQERWDASKPDENSIPWSQFPFQDRGQVLRMMDLDEAWLTFCEGENVTWFSPDPKKRKATFRAALDAVRAYREAVERNDRESGLDAASDRYDELSEKIADTRKTLMDMPAPDLPALAWKLQQLRGESGSLDCWSAEYVEQTFADIDRLLGGQV